MGPESGLPGIRSAQPSKGTEGAWSRVTAPDLGVLIRLMAAPLRYALALQSLVGLLKSGWPGDLVTLHFPLVSRSLRYAVPGSERRPPSRSGGYETVSPLVPKPQGS